MSEIEKFLQQHEMDVVLVVFDKESVTLSSELYGDIDKYISDNYVDAFRMRTSGCLGTWRPWPVLMNAALRM